MTKKTEKVVSLDQTNQFEASKAVLIGNGLMAVRTPPQQKDPGHYGWEPKTNSAQAVPGILDLAVKNGDNIGVHVCEDIVDIDVDNNNPYLLEALDTLLPSTAHVWGREGKPRSHRLYRIRPRMGQGYNPNEYRFLSDIARQKDLSTEVRGGPKNSAGYSLLPGSLHPSGELYTWQNYNAARSMSLELHDIDAIMTAVRRAVFVGMIAPHWTEGGRHQLGMALAGTLYKAHEVSQEHANDENFPLLSKDDAIALFKLVQQCADDEEHRLPSFESTWRKAEAGSPHTGVTGLSELIATTERSMEENRALIYSLMIGSPGMQVVDEFMEDNIQVLHSGMIYQRSLAKKTNSIGFIEKGKWSDGYSHLTYEQPSGGIGKLVTYFQHSSRKKLADMLTFDPSREEDFFQDANGANVLNMWRGWAIPPHDEPVPDDEVQPFLDYIREIVANNDDAANQWVLGWLADIVQHPNDKCGTALVLVGEQGAGKSFLGFEILAPLLKQDNWTKFNSLKDFTNNFNSRLGQTLIAMIEEVVNSTSIQVGFQMKDMVTAQMRTVEPKGVDAYAEPDHTRYIFSSNKDNPLPIEPGDRRYTLLSVNSRYAAHSTQESAAAVSAYWAHMYMWHRDKENLAKIHRWLLDHKYERSLVRTALDTDHKMKAIADDLSGEKLLLRELVEHVGNPLIALDTKSRPYPPAAYRVRKLLSQGTTVDRIELAREEWPEWIELSELIEFRERIVKPRVINRGRVGDYNAQTLKKSLESFGLIPRNSESKKKRHQPKDSSENSPKMVRLYPFPPRDHIIQFLKSKGVEWNEGKMEEVEDDEDHSEDNF